MLYLLVLVLSVNTAVSNAVDTSESRDDLTDHLGDDEDILARSRRSAKPGLCKYKKGEWSPCD